MLHRRQSGYLLAVAIMCFLSHPMFTLLLFRFSPLLVSFLFH
jgi:hypothetical protein